MTACTCSEGLVFTKNTKTGATTAWACKCPLGDPHRRLPTWGGGVPQPPPKDPPPPSGKALAAKNDD